MHHVMIGQLAHGLGTMDYSEWVALDWWPVTSGIPQSSILGFQDENFLDLAENIREKVAAPSDQGLSY